MAAPRDLTIYYLNAELQDDISFDNGPHFAEVSPPFPAIPEAAYAHPAVISAQDAPQVCQLVEQYSNIKMLPPHISDELDLVAARISVERYINEHLPILRLTIFAPAIAYAVGIIGITDTDLLYHVSSNKDLHSALVWDLFVERRYHLDAEQCRQVQVLMTLCAALSRGKLGWAAFATALEELEASSSTKAAPSPYEDYRPLWKRLLFRLALQVVRISIRQSMTAVHSSP
ncbi:hypothetical protein MNV49_006147 [Pseudohyphozyma bogoriensis]|nr:hypothetical protein MNV49_006147 [Pseudohyphozyma bogoriensis]